MKWYIFVRTAFPYYIVRFKQNFLFEVAMYCSGFHTTQYDLNFFFFSLSVIIYFSFHTTQYDLNRKHRIFKCRRNSSFHTTQYDLNLHYYCSFFFFLFRFPYYIVRFKRGRSFYAGKKRRRFPYYIVRFKPFEFCVSSILYYRFHTTQYDLNLHTDLSL